MKARCIHHYINGYPIALRKNDYVLQAYVQPIFYFLKAYVDQSIFVTNYTCCKMELEGEVWKIKLCLDAKQCCK